MGILFRAFFCNFRGRPIGGSVMHVIGRQTVGLIVTAYSNARDRKADSRLDCYCVQYSSFIDLIYANCSVSKQAVLWDTEHVVNSLSRAPVHRVAWALCSSNRPHLWRRTNQSMSVASVDNLTGNNSTWNATSSKHLWREHVKCQAFLISTLRSWLLLPSGTDHNTWMEPRELPDLTVQSTRNVFTTALTL